MVKLGDLEFKTEDVDTGGRDAMYTPCITIEKANRLLAERLEKAPTVYGREAGLGEGFWDWSDDSCQTKSDTHIAKIVCVEEIKP